MTHETKGGDTTTTVMRFNNYMLTPRAWLSLPRNHNFRGVCCTLGYRRDTPPVWMECESRSKHGRIGERANVYGDQKKCPQRDCATGGGPH